MNDGTIDVGANAVGAGTEGSAYAYAEGILQFAGAGLGGTATGPGNIAVALASVENIGSINVHANAALEGDGGYASASAGASGILQDAGAFAASATGALAIAQVINEGTIAVNATALASGYGYVAAAAEGLGIFQDAGAEATFSAVASAIVHNDLTISVIADAHAQETALGDGEGNSVRAGAEVLGIDQNARASADGTDIEGFASALASITNAGLILASGNAFAFGSDAGAQVTVDAIWQDAQAFASVITAIAQASALLENTGDISAIAGATGFGIVEGYASAFATAIDQSASASDVALASVVNTSLATINVSAHAAANGNVANASVYAAGIFQDATAFTSGVQDPVVVASAQALVDNAGLLSVNAAATAEGANVSATAGALGIDQSAEIEFFGEGFGGSSSAALASVVNSGAIEVAAAASALGGNIAGAYANATGIDQDAYAVNLIGSNARARVDNSGSINVTATAIAEADVFGSATAGAVGIDQEVGDAESLFAEVVNTESAEIVVGASASATGYRAIADAGAIAIDQAVFGAGYGTSQAALLSVDNDGVITVAATAVAEAGKELLDFVSEARAHATATGINQRAYSIGTTVTTLTAVGTATNPSGAITEIVTNNGELNVSASANASGGNDNSAAAYAAGVLQSGSGLAELFDLAVVNVGTNDVAATAVADGDDDGYAFAEATGVGQGVEGGFAANQTNVTVPQVAVLSVETAATFLSSRLQAPWARMKRLRQRTP